MSELIMPKNEGRLDFFDESIRYIYENDGIMKTDEFVEKIQQAHPGMDTTSCYHKIVMARYFGLVLFNSHSSYYFLTEAGSVYSNANNQNKKIDAILKALTSVSFGRNNNAVSSNSDIEAPVVMLKTIASMGSASMTQIGLILYHMDRNDMTLSEAIAEVEKCADPSAMRRSLTENKHSKYFDVKFNKLFEELGIVEKKQGNYILSKYVKENHISFINNLPELKPIVSKGDSDNTNLAPSYKDIFNHNLYGIHIKEENDALSEERPHICIGWSGMGDLSGVSTKEELSTKHEVAYPDSKPRAKGQNIGQIWKFVKEAAIGDYVVFAEDNVCHIGRITSGYYFDKNTYPHQSDDYVNVHDVEWLKTNIKRSDLSKNFHNSLSASRSFWGLNDYKSAVAQLLDGSYVKDEFDNSENIDLTLPTVRVEGDFSVQELGNILSEMYNSSENKTTAIHMFGIKYGEIILRNNYTASEIVKASTIAESYNVEVSKGIRIYEALLNNEYGVAFGEEKNDNSLITFNTGYESKFARNRILFGAPGTGKSFTLNGDRKEILYGDREADESSIDLSQCGEYERVTFHPDYSYANFVGTHKPVPCKDESDKDGITYEYVPGPFMRTYVKALLNSKTETPKPYLLIIEEINRANVAAVFGDVFQLLDRGEDEVSEYPIQASEDMKKYLAKALGGDPEDYAEIRIPDNMFIWATMNSADQGVFPMDTAFKRRWDFTYLGIDDSEDGIAGKTVVLGKGKQNSRIVEWNELRKAINEELLKYKVNEDKLMGPYFISKKNLPEGTDIDPKEFTRIFKNKVIMYLFDDAAKQKRTTLFEGCEEKSRNQYSKICNEFDEKGVLIFGSSISDKFTVIPEDDEQ